MKKTLFNVAVLTLGMPLATGVAYAAPGTATATITMAGAQVAPINGAVSCRYEYTGFVLQAGHDRGSAWVKISHAPSIDGQPLKVDDVRITQTNGAEYDYHDTIPGNRGDVQYQGPPDPTAHQSGNYKITGNLPQTSSPNGPINSQTSPMAPFEINFTCP